MFIFLVMEYKSLTTVFGQKFPSLIFNPMNQIIMEFWQLLSI